MLRDRSGSVGKSPIDGNRDLARTLKDQALASSPAFSQALHSRIMDTVRDCAASDLPPNPHSVIRSVAPYRSWMLPALSAASIALLVTAWWFHHSPATNSIARATSAPYASMPGMTVHFPAFTETQNSQLNQARFGYIDRDATNAARYVIGQFNVLPAVHGRRG